MRRHVLWGLGALSLACASTPPPRPVDNTEHARQLAVTAQEVAQQMAECDKLREKVAVQEEYALGAAVAANWVKGGGGLMLSEGVEKELERYVNLVGGNLAAQSSRPALQWTFGVLEEPKAFNAASAPGGYVFVTFGLLKNVENEAQLAGVLAHEIAHVTLRHALTRYDEVKVRQCKMAAGLQAMMKRMRQGDMLQGNAAMAGFHDALAKGALDLDKHHDLLVMLTDRLVEKIVTEGFAEGDEYAADEEAVRLLLSAGYDPEEYIRFLGKLPDVHDGYAHHPGKGVRQSNLRHLLNRAARGSDDFPELPAGTSGLRRPPLPPVFSGLKAGQ